MQGHMHKHKRPRERMHGRARASTSYVRTYTQTAPPTRFAMPSVFHADCSSYCPCDACECHARANGTCASPWRAGVFHGQARVFAFTAGLRTHDISRES
eukprot:14838080-Alexandrium_andersonii.AAC.1